MKRIYLIKAFDTETWTQFFPVAFSTEGEAVAYCDAHSGEHGIVYIYVPVALGKYKKKVDSSTKFLRKVACECIKCK